MSDEDNRDIHWSNQLEDLIAGEAEKCRGLSWIHQQAEQIASTKNNYIQIPVIVLSTLCGTASVSSQTLFGPGNATVAGIAIGLVSISVGVLNTINSYFAFARKSEAHHIAQIQYAKLFSNISVELALPRLERLPPQILLKTLREQMERLAETTPTPPASVYKDFTTRFAKYTTVSKPIETNGLQKVEIFRPLSIKIPVDKANDSVDGRIEGVESGQVGVVRATQGDSGLRRGRSIDGPPAQAGSVGTHESIRDAVQENEADGAGSSQA